MPVLRPTTSTAWRHSRLGLRFRGLAARIARLFSMIARMSHASAAQWQVLGDQLIRDVVRRDCQSVFGERSLTVAARQISRLR